jgi:hypothetical protein
MKIFYKYCTFLCNLQIILCADQRENLNQQSWDDSGHLMAQGGIDYSAKNVNTLVEQDHINRYSLAKLERYV